MSKFCNPSPNRQVPERFRGATIPLSLVGLFLIILAVSLTAFAGITHTAEAREECAGPAVCDPTVKATSRSPAARTGYEVSFTTPEAIGALTGSIVMELHEDIRVPMGIAPNAVRIRFTDDSRTVRGTAAFVELADQDDPRHPTTVRIAHSLMNGQTRTNISANSEVTIRFEPGAGISNPTEGGAFSWKVGVGNDDHLVDANYPEPEDGEPDVRAAFRAASAGGEGSDIGLLVDREIQLSHEEISRGQSITVIARGYKNGHTLTVWRDANVDGVRDSGESELCQVEVAGNDIGYCDFTVHSPPFVAGFGKCSDKDDMGVPDPNADLDCNFINAIDGLSGSSIIVKDVPSSPAENYMDPIYDADQALELVGRIVADTVQGPGGDIQLELIDFPVGVITAVTIGGIPADVGELRVSPPGRLYFSVPVPDNVRLGRQYLRVEMFKTADGCRGNEGTMPECNFSDEVIVDISQPKALVRIFPETVLPNQRVSLSGLGFNDENGTTINEVRFGGFILKPSHVNEGVGSIDVSGDGKWNGSVDLPIVESTVTEGVHTLRVTDSRGRAGSVEVTVPPREVEVAPIWGRPGTLVTVTGTGFPSRNDHGSSVNLRIYYESGETFTVVSAEPDVNGNFSREVQIPLRTPTPSSNFVRVEFEDDNGAMVATMTPHEVPGAVVRLFPDSGPPGTPVTMRGYGFRHHVPLAQVNFAQIDVSPGQHGFHGRQWRVRGGTDGSRPGNWAADRSGNRSRDYRQRHLRY